MDKRKKYFIKQKLMGVMTLLLSIITVVILEGDITAALLLTSLGIALIFTKEMCITDSYFFEVKNNEEL